ncbi:MAG: cytotoxic translational repressor of toxin-antitoxin stability system [Desulfovibrionaceae bacterium]
MKWTVMITGNARKGLKKLPPDIYAALYTLKREMEECGPVLPHWPHFSKLVGKAGVYHCHLNKGKPRYVAVWRVNKEQLELLEIRYVGAHEKADYRRID